MWLALGLTLGCYSSGATNEFGSCYTGVRLGSSSPFRWCCSCPFASRMRGVLRVLWKVVGWFCLGLPSAAGSVDGELRSRSRMGRGAASVDGRPPMASSRRSRRVSSSTPFKACGRWDSSCSRWCPASSSVAAAGDEDDECLRLALDPGTSV